MSKVATNNKTTYNHKVSDTQYIKCQQQSAQRIMGSNTSRHRTGTNTLDASSEMAMETAPASASPALPPNVKNALRERRKCPRGMRRVQNVRSALKPKAAFTGSVSESVGGCASTKTSIECTDMTLCYNLSGKLVGGDDVEKVTSTCGASLSSHSAEDGASIVDSGLPQAVPDSAQRSSCIQITRDPVAGNRTTKAKTNIKIATTKTQTAALAVARLPRTHTTTRKARAARAALAATQLTKAKKITANTTTVTPATAAATTTANERVEIAVTTPAVAAVETYSDATRRTPSSVRLTSPTTMSMVVTAQVEGAFTAVDVKSKFTENKCPSSVPANVSNQRKVEANSTLPAPKKYTLNSNNNSSYSSSRASAVPINKWPEGLYSVDAEYEHSGTGRARANTSSNSSTKDIIRTLNLATRKAKLKSEFFRDFNSAEQASKRLTQSSTVINVCDVDLRKRFLNNSQYNLLQSQSHPDVNQPISWPATVLPTISVHAVDTTLPISLVARRKLDLKRKFEQQSSPKTSPNCDQQFLISEAGVFPCVEELVQMFDLQPISSTRKMIVHPNKSSEAANSTMLTLKPDVLEQRSSPLSDEGCNLGQSPYSSDNEENEPTHTTSTPVEESKHKEKVARSASSDSALGLDVDESMDTTPAQGPGDTQQRRMTLTVTDLPLRPALLPLAEPTALPDSPTIDLQQTVNNLAGQTSVPSKVLLEERVVELPEDPRSLAPSQPCSRRESAQSCGSDYTPTDFPGGRRFVRTPSVVVSDYSDDVMCGITLEEIEYFRAQRMKRRHSSLDTANEGEGESDVSAASSCSNLYYCGSTISALDGNECYVNGLRTSLDRKTSDCSTYSVSADEESFTIPEDPPQQTAKDLADLLAAQHLSSKQTTKKVGLVVPITENLGEKVTF